MIGRIGAMLLTVAMLCTYGCASGESYTRPDFHFGSVESVAVVSVEGQVRGEAGKNQIADFFAMELLKKGYRVVERGQVKALLAEQEFQASEFTRPEGAAQVGRILNVSAIVLVNVPRLNERIEMTAKMLDVEDASILWMGSGSGTTGRTMATVGGALLGAGAGAAAGGSRSGKVAAGAAGAVVGGMAGYALSPEQATQVRKIIGRMCESLPGRY